MRKVSAYDFPPIYSETMSAEERQALGLSPSTMGEEHGRGLSIWKLLAIGVLLGVIGYLISLHYAPIKQPQPETKRQPIEFRGRPAPLTGDMAVDLYNIAHENDSKIIVGVVHDGDWNLAEAYRKGIAPAAPYSHGSDVWFQYRH